MQPDVSPVRARSRWWLTGHASTLAYLAGYVALAAFAQSRSKMPPAHPDAPIEYFTGGLLWMLALCALLLANRRDALPRKALWLLGCIALSALALDEHFEVHEHSKQAVGDDDPLKVVLFLASGIALVVIYRLERPPRATLAGFAIGCLFQLGYLLVEAGDGDLFRLPVLSKDQLKWLEEFFEMLFLASFLFAFVGMVEAKPREPLRAP